MWKTSEQKLRVIQDRRGTPGHFTHTELQQQGHLRQKEGTTAYDMSKIKIAVLGQTLA